MPLHPAMLAESEFLADCEMKTTRRGGPGGQHRNKVETAVILTHTPTGIIAEANEKRSQAANRQRAVHRLRVRLAIEVRSATPASSPSELWKGRVQGGRIAVNPEHADFPALLAEALDQLAACDLDAASSAEQLGVSATQLVKLVRLAPAALVAWNEARAERGLRPLK